MPAAATDVPTPALVPGAHRVIRTIESHEGPFTGVLVTRGDAVAVRVDAAELAGWEGWRFGGSEHVVGPLDIVRRAQGHDALLPWCTQRVSTFVGIRTAAGAGLSSGECSTLLVSLFRALGELGREDTVAGATGAWWLTDDGRPVLVLGEGDEARRGVAMLVAQVGESCADKTLGRLLGVVEEGLRTNIEQQRWVPPLLLEKWEREVLEVAAPRPLRRECVTADGAETAAGTALRRESMSSLPPSPHEGATPGRSALRGRRLRRVRRRSGARQRSGVRRRSGARQRSGAQRSRRPDQVGRGAPQASVTALATIVVSRLRGHAEDVRGRFDRGQAQERAAPQRSALRPRRRSLLVAAGAAIAVLLIGLLWPSGATSEVADGAQEAVDASPGSASGEGDAGAPSPVAAPRGGTSDTTPSMQSGPSAAASKPMGVTDDPTGAASWLLMEIAKCEDAGDAVCADAVADGSSDVIAELAGDSVEPDVGDAADTADVELVDEYGDVAVVRLTAQETRNAEAARDAGAEGGRILVLVRINEKWLVRDVYDVADQPG